MSSLVQIQTADRELLDAIAETMAKAARRSGEWLQCRPGCMQCCMGPFAITQLDALRLRQGLEELSSADPGRAAALRERAQSYVRVTAPSYPGDPLSGALSDEDSLPAFLDDIPCPALDPATGWCDLYAARPVTCRTFGPVTRADENTLQHCELCYQGASEQEVVNCAVDIDPGGLESALVGALAAEGIDGMTIVAYALAAKPAAMVSRTAERP